MNKLPIFYSLVAVTLVGCNDKELDTKPTEPRTQTLTLTAYTEGGDASTRVSFSEPDAAKAGQPISLKWQTGDAISCLSFYTDDPYGGDPESHSDKLTLTGEGGSSQCTFTGADIPYGPEQFLLLSPYQANAQTADEDCYQMLHVVLPVVQEAVAGSVDPHAALMVSRIETGDTEAHFRNVCSYLAIKPAYNCNAITIESLDPSQLMAGEVTIDWNDGTPITRVETYYEDVVTQRFGASHVALVGDIEAGKTYYIAVLPGSLTQGIRITAFSDDKYAQATNQNIVIPVRSKYHDLTQHLPSTPDTDLYVDLGLSDGTKWATMNLGASIPEDCGDYYAWGETSPLWSFGTNNGYDFYKTIANWNTYIWGDWYDHSSITAQFVSKYKNDDSKEYLEASDIAASRIWGNDWEMPNKSQFENLINGCTWELVYHPGPSLSGIDGFLGTSKQNGNTIFLPLAGHYSFVSNSTLSTDPISFEQVDSYYWSCQVSQNNNDGNNGYYSYAHALALDQDIESPLLIMACWRCYAFPIRPVRKTTITE